MMSSLSRLRLGRFGARRFVAWLGLTREPVLLSPSALMIFFCSSSAARSMPPHFLLHPDSQRALIRHGNRT